MRNLDPTGRADGAWHLDKRVNIALIVTLLVQTAGWMTAVGDLNATIRHMDRRIERLEVLRAADDRETTVLKESLAEIKADIRWVRERIAASERAGGPR